MAKEKDSRNHKAALLPEDASLIVTPAGAPGSKGHEACRFGVHVVPCPDAPLPCDDCVAGRHDACDDYDCGCCYAHK